MDHEPDEGKGNSMNIPMDMVPHVAKIFAGEYQIGYQKDKPVILDIGANVGGFACWAAMRWPGATIYCYEPLKRNYDLLRSNAPFVFSRQVGIGLPGEREIWIGKNNCGEASLYKGDQNTDESEMVQIVSPASLPRADIVKIDTEGAELEILEEMPFDPDVYLIEFHSENIRRNIDRLLSNYSLMECRIDAPWLGVVKYVRTDLLSKQ